MILLVYKATIFADMRLMGQFFIFCVHNNAQIFFEILILSIVSALFQRPKIIKYMSPTHFSFLVHRLHIQSVIVSQCHCKHTHICARWMHESQHWFSHLPSINFFIILSFLQRPKHTKYGSNQFLLFCTLTLYSVQLCAFVSVFLTLKFMSVRVIIYMSRFYFGLDKYAKVTAQCASQDCHTAEIMVWIIIVNLTCCKLLQQFSSHQLWHRNKRKLQNTIHSFTTTALPPHLHICPIGIKSEHI